MWQFAGQVITISSFVLMSLFIFNKCFSLSSKFFGVIFIGQCNSFSVLHTNITMNWYGNYISRSHAMRHSMLKLAVFPCQLPT